MRNVLIFRELLLPPSETFVLAQAAALLAVSASLLRTHGCTAYAPVPRPIRLTNHDALFARYRMEGYRRMHWAPLFHRAGRAVRILR